MAPISFDVGRYGAGSHVSAMPENGVTHIIEVRNLYTVKKDAVFDLAGIAYNGTFSHKYSPSEIGAMANNRPLSHDARRVETGRRRNFCAFGDPDVFCGIVILIMGQGVSQLLYEVGNFTKCFPWVCEGREIIGGEGVG